MLESEQRQTWIEAILTVMALIHPIDTKKMSEQMGLAAERQELRKTMLELVSDEIEQREAKVKQESRRETLHESARQM